MKKVLLIFIFIPLFTLGQTKSFPIFKECEETDVKEQKFCFYKQTKQYFFKEFKAPKIIEEELFKGTVNTTFIVDNSGNFKSISTNSPYIELQQEVERVFSTFPRIKPAIYNNHTTESHFILPITFPLPENPFAVNLSEDNKIDLKITAEQQQLADSTFLELNSQLNIPFTHHYYTDFEHKLHLQKDFHTASKPFTYKNVSKHYDFNKERASFLKPDTYSWLGRKLWNEHLLQIKRKDFWFTFDFLVDTQLGKDNSNEKYTYNNTRFATFNGAFGKNFAFSATVYESQGRFAEYVNDYNGNPDKKTFKPVSSEGIVTGRGKAKGFGSGFDYPVAEGYLSYAPSKFMDFQFGHGKNFIGDGYRSLLLSDISSPSTYLKMNVNFWRFKYSNTWIWGQDVREFLANDNNRAHTRKYIATHYLSINVSDRLNLGLFEGAISSGDDGFDASFLVPVMFYRSVEFNRGADVGNAVLGLNAKYKFSDNFVGYSQVLIDEFSFGNLNNLSDWRNKFGFQIGGKYFNAFKVKNLFLQGELNYVRPYTYAHKNPILNYGHYSESLAHSWGSNFWESILIARYKVKRWNGFTKIIYGQKGFDYAKGKSYGGNIYRSYEDRVSNKNNSNTQGNKATIFMIDTQVNYLLNPSNRLSLFSGFTYRSFKANKADELIYKNGPTFWFTIGLKADLFNWYFDF